MVTDSTVKESAGHVRRLERLLEASRLLNSTLELSELTQVVLRIVRDEVRVDRCTLFVLDRKHNLLRSYIAQGVERFEITLPVGQGLAGTVAATGEVLDVDDVYDDERFNAQFDSGLGYHTRDVLCMPVFNCEGNLIGVLELLNRMGPLGSQDKEFLSTMCTYIGLALQNAWNHRELQESARLEEELRDVRERLARAEKLSAMSELVAGIVHEIRNPLAVSLGQCTLLREESPASLGGRISKIEGSIDQALRIAKNFLSLGRATETEHVPADINGILTQTVDLLAYAFRTRGVSVTLDLAKLPPVKIDPGSIQQVLLNIMKNAMEAVEEATEKAVVVRSGYDEKARTIRIELKDSGPGIPPDVQMRIFEPLFTTKPRGSGNGLGLAVSRRLVQRHLGTLRFHSAPGEGTTFFVELPASENDEGTA